MRCKDGVNEMKNIWKNAGFLFLRFFTFCVLVFMTIPLIATMPTVLGPVMGVFYLIAVAYFWGFTSHAEGLKDRNRVSIGQEKEFLLKGFVCALIVAVPLMLLNLVPLFFPDHIDAEYRQTYFTDEVTSVQAGDRFNRQLQEASGGSGNVTEVWFDTNGQLRGLVYQTSGGLYVKCDGTVADESRMYTVSESPMSLNTKDENALSSSADNLNDAQIEAFSQCRTAMQKVTSVLGTRPVWEQVFGIIKQVLAMCLIYFCNIFTGGVALWNSVLYCVCLLFLCGASGVGYYMGYRGIEIAMPWGKKK